MLDKRCVCLQQADDEAEQEMYVCMYVVDDALDCSGTVYICGCFFFIVHRYVPKTWCVVGCASSVIIMALQGQVQCCEE